MFAVWLPEVPRDSGTVRSNLSPATSVFFTRAFFSRLALGVFTQIKLLLAHLIYQILDDSLSCPSVKFLKTIPRVFLLSSEKNNG